MSGTTIIVLIILLAAVVAMVARRGGPRVTHITRTVRKERDDTDA